MVSFDNSGNKNFATSIPPKKKSGPWLWVILGLVVLGTPMLACGGCIYFAYSMFSAPVTAAVDALNDSPQVTDKLGSPVKMTGGMSISDYQNDNGNGKADLEFNVSGPKGNARVSGSMKGVAGTWSPNILTVTFDDGSTVTVQ